MESINIIYIISIFAAGTVSFFAPCIIPLLPVYVATLSTRAGEDEANKINGSFNINKRLIVQTIVFVLGLATTFVMLGFGAGALGRVLGGKTFLYICGVIVIAMGIYQTGILRLPFMEKEKRLELASSNNGGVLGAYLLGFSFSFGWTPCVGSILASVLAVSSTGNHPLLGAGLMLVYTLGLSIPFLLIAVFTNYFLRLFKSLNKHLVKIKVAGGVLIILMGIFLITDNLNLISRLFI